MIHRVHHYASIKHIFQFSKCHADKPHCHPNQINYDGFKQDPSILAVALLLQPSTRTRRHYPHTLLQHEELWTAMLAVACFQGMLAAATWPGQLLHHLACSLLGPTNHHRHCHHREERAGSWELGGGCPSPRGWWLQWVPRERFCVPLRVREAPRCQWSRKPCSTLPNGLYSRHHFPSHEIAVLHTHYMTVCLVIACVEVIVGSTLHDRGHTLHNVSQDGESTHTPQGDMHKM